MRSCSSIVGFALLASLHVCSAALISNVFGTHMVLQRGRDIPVWGWTTSGSSVHGSLGGGAVLTTTADSSGFWRVSFPPLAAGGGPLTLEMTSSSGETATLVDILMGDVVLCSGQSNMEYTTNDVVNATAELAAANHYPFIRVTSGPLQGKLHLFDLPQHASKELVAVDLPWSVANNESIGGVGGAGVWDYFSAACWLSLKNLADKNEAAGAPVPLGGVVQCYGGTSIQWWSGPSALAACPASASNPGSACCGYGGNASCLYNAQIAPYTYGPTRFSAVLWYQGEQNAGCGGPPQVPYYSCALPALISEWRALFESPSLPFGVFLLAAWQATSDAFPLLRLAQVAASEALAAVFTVSTLDAGEPKGGPVHSPYKQVPGARAATALSALVYGRTDALYRGPRAVVASSSPAAPGSDASATVTFAPESLYGGALALDATVGCPATIASAACEAFAVQTAGDCAWVLSAPAGPVVPTLRGDGALSLTLPAAARAPGAGSIVAVRGFFANWPLVQLRAAETGLPAEPWLLNTTSSNTCAPPEAPAHSWRSDGTHA